MFGHDWEYWEYWEMVLSLFDCDALGATLRLDFCTNRILLGDQWIAAYWSQKIKI